MEEAAANVNLAAKLPQYVAALSATLGAFAMGTCLGWNSPIEDHLKEQLNRPNYEVSWIGSVFALGAASVLIPLPYTLDRFGRKVVMLALMIPLFLGWVIIIAATQITNSDGAIAAYLLGRILTGLSVGGFCVAAPAFIGEISEPAIRGTLGIFFQLMIVSGILYAYVLGAFVDILWLSVACSVVPLIFGIIFFFIPESPYYLVLLARHEQAERALQWFRGKTYEWREEIAAITADVAAAQTHQGQFRESMKKREAKRSLFIGVGLMLCQQLCGINAVIFHAKMIFSMSKTGIEPHHASIYLGIVQFVSCLVAATVVNRAGGKLLMIISMTGMCVCHIALGTYFTFYTRDKDSVTSVTWLPLVALASFLVAFSVGAGPIPWATLGELFPPEIKGIAASTCAFLNWILAFIVTYTFHFLVEGIGEAGPFWIFAVLCAVGVAFVVVFCIETKGKSLEEIQMILKG